MPARIQLGESPHAAEAVELFTARKHLTNVLEMASYQIESALVEQPRPHYARTDDEGRTLIQERPARVRRDRTDRRRTAVHARGAQFSAPIDGLRVLCNDLNGTATLFPATNLRFTFAVAQTPVL